MAAGGWYVYFTSPLPRLQEHRIAIMLASAAVTRLALLPAFVHAFGTIGTIEPGSGTNEPCKLVEPASWAQIDFEEFTRASWFGQEQASEGNRVAC